MKDKLRTLFYILFCPIATFYLLEWYTHNPFANMKTPIQILNMVFYVLTAVLFFFLFGRLRIALMAETSFFMLFGLINYFVLQFRSAPIMPWDLLSLGTATSVAGNYSYKPDTTAIMVLIGFVLLLALEFTCPAKLTFPWKKRLLAGCGAALLIWSYMFMLHQDNTVLRFRLYDKLFTPTTMMQRDGTVVAFLMQLEYMSVSKPDGYQAEDAMAVLDTYADASADTDVSDGTNASAHPNIIVIMDEAFADLNILGDFQTNTDYMPFIRGLMEGAEDTVSGRLHVSILGGNTPNTEFEYLTGNTMAFLPQGSIPFQQYIKSEIPSMVSYLLDTGYQTIAMHPYHSSGWDRDTTYPFLGFEESYFLEAFSDAGYVRNYVSDQSSFDKIIELYEQKEEGRPLFLFNVTMQNHSSYSDAFDNFTPEITVEGTSSQILPNYLSLLKVTDDAFANLVNYFQQQEEDTIIVFFGDHQPTNSVVEPIVKQNDADEALRYQVPFIIWANYDIEEASDMETSANYLGAHTLRLANLPLPAYFTFLEEQEKSFPILTAIQAVDSSGNAAPIKEQQEALSLYEKLQYYQLFGTQKD